MITEITCIVCGRKRKSDHVKWWNMCFCEKMVHKNDGFYELRMRSNGRKLHIDDLDEYNPPENIWYKSQPNQIHLWNLVQVEEVAKQYQTSFKCINLPVPDLDLYIFNGKEKVDKIVPINSFV